MENSEAADTPDNVSEQPPEAAALEERYPQWTIWCSETGTWWSSWKERWNSGREQHGCQPFLQAPSSEELEVVLLAQKDCAECAKLAGTPKERS